MESVVIDVNVLDLLADFAQSIRFELFRGSFLYNG